MKRLPKAPPLRRARESGQGISLTTIVIAVLGLIVLVVLIVIFTGQTGKFTKGTSEAVGGTVCERSAEKLPDVTSLGGTWHMGNCPAGTTATAKPTYPPDAAVHYGWSCCTGTPTNVVTGSRPTGTSGPAP